MKFIPFSTNGHYYQLSSDEFQKIYNLGIYFISNSIIYYFKAIENNIGIGGFLIDQNNQVIAKLDHTNINQFKEKYLALL